MRDYSSILERMPVELQGPLADFAEAIENQLRSELRDITRLENIVAEIVATQQKTDQTVAELVELQKQTRVELNELAEAQKRTEQTVAQLAEGQREMRVELKELAQAQKQTDQTVRALSAEVKELAQAQRQTEKTVEELAQAQRQTEKTVEELAQAQKQTEKVVQDLAQSVKRLDNTFESKVGGLGARWGLQTEASFRNAMRGILADLGFRVEKYIAQDTEGQVFPAPDQVELDVVVQDGKLIIVEIKSSMSTADFYAFERKVKFYEEKEGKTADRKVIVTTFIDPKAAEIAEERGFEVFTDINKVS